MRNNSLKCQRKSIEENFKCKWSNISKISTTIFVTESMDGCAMAVLDECKVLSEGGRPKSMIEVSSRNLYILVAFQNLK